MNTLDSRNLLQLPTVLLLSGQSLYIAVTQLHAGGDANDHHHIFAHYAEDGLWTAVHLGQFLAMAMLLGGLLMLARTIEARGTAGSALARLGGGAALLTLALCGALQAVDGVALQRAVTAWVVAPDSEKAARFASAESIRWLEWGMRSYHDFGMALTLLAVAAAIVASRAVAQPVGWLMGLSGLAYLAQGWVAGTDGFTSTQSAAIVAAWAFSIVWMGWLLFDAVRPGGADAAARPATA